MGPRHGGLDPEKSKTNLSKSFVTFRLIRKGSSTTPSLSTKATDCQLPSGISEISQRIAEAVFAAIVQPLPDRVTAAPAGTSGNFALGGFDADQGRDFVMYQLSGGGYGGSAEGDGLSNGCSTIGISKAPPVEIMEQTFPVLYHHYRLREGSAGPGFARGGFGLDYKLELRNGEARASFVMDHGRFGPQGALGGGDGAVNLSLIHI